MCRIPLIVLLILFIFAAVPGAEAVEAAAPEYLRKELAGMVTVPAGTWFALSKEHFKLFVMDGERVVETFDIAVGRNKGQKQKAGDNRTPEGMFKIIQVQDASYWTHDFRDGKGEIKGAYGPWFIRLETGWKGIGIHGTHDPKSIGTNATEGCIRLSNENLRRLKENYVKLGLKVLILK